MVANPRDQRHFNTRCNASPSSATDRDWPIPGSCALAMHRLVACRGCLVRVGASRTFHIRCTSLSRAPSLNCVDPAHLLPFVPPLHTPYFPAHVSALWHFRSHPSAPLLAHHRLCLDSAVSWPGGSLFYLFSSSPFITGSVSRRSINSLAGPCRVTFRTGTKTHRWTIPCTYHPKADMLPRTMRRIG